MHKLIISILLLASVTIALCDWEYFVTFSDNCITPVAVQLSSGPFCVNKRSEQGSAPMCDPLTSNENYQYYRSVVCGSAMPNITEIASLPLAIMTYPGSNNCTEKDYVVNYYFAENYVGPMVYRGGEDTYEVQVNTSCSDSGVLSSQLCFGGECLTFTATATEQCTIDESIEMSLSQIGCVAQAPTAPETPTQGAAPQNQPQAQPTSVPSARTPSKTSAAAVVSSVIGIIFGVPSVIGLLF